MIKKEFGYVLVCYSIYCFCNFILYLAARITCCFAKSIIIAGVMNGKGCGLLKNLFFNQEIFFGQIVKPVQKLLQHYTTAIKLYIFKMKRNIRRKP